MAIKDLTKIEKHLLLCNGGSCKQSGAEETILAIRAAIRDNGLTEQVHTTKTLCNGRCKDGPIVISLPDGIWFKKMSKEISVDFVKQLLEKKVILPEHILFEYGDDDIYTDEEVRRRSESGEEDCSAYY